MFGKAIYHDNGAAAIRYPRGKENEMPEDYHYDKSDYSVFGGVNSENCIITYGREFSECYAAYKELDNTFIIKLNKIKPVEKSILTLLADAKNVYFYEESIKTGSVGEIVAAMLKENNIDVHFKHIAIEDEFVKQATIESQIKTYKLDRDSIVNEVSNV